MKLRNKKTGEIRDFIINKDKIQTASAIDCWEYNSLAELNEEWEDVPTEEVWYLGERIGNFSMPKEEAREATEKILAWKRLRNNGFRFKKYSPIHMSINYGLSDYYDEAEKDLDLLFGGEK